MKKRILLICLAAALAAALAALAGCRCAATYTVTFRNGAETFAVRSFRAGEEVALGGLFDDLPERTGEGKQYVFSGWAYAEDGERTDKLTVNEDVTLYALFEEQTAAERFTVTFVHEWEGRRTVLSTQTVAKGEYASAPEPPAVEGFGFSGWDRDPKTTPIMGRTEFKTVYSRLNFSLTRSVLGETVREEVAFGADVLLTPPVLPHGLIFGGWFSEEDCTGEALSSLKMPAHELTLYAAAEVDFSDAHIAGEGFVYGDGRTASVQGLPETEGLTYSYAWQNGGDGAECSLPSAGEHALSVTVTARYGRGEFVLTDETQLEKTVTVAKRPLSAALSLERDTVVYGEMPVPSLAYEGLLEGDDPSARFRYLKGGEEETASPLPAGEYTAEAVIGNENYDLSPVLSVPFTVEKKELTVTAAQSNFVYGGSPSPVLSFEGFAAGEDEEVLQTSGEPFTYQKGGQPYLAERFSAGDYTVSPAAGHFRSDNYEILLREGSFTVGKAPVEVTVTLGSDTLVYGETPEASVSPVAFAFPDENEDVFGGLTVRFLEEGGAEHGLPLSVGRYRAEAAAGHEPENYEARYTPASFEVVKKEITARLQPLRSVYGDEIAPPVPEVEGLLPADGELDEEMEFSVTCEGEALTRFTAAGEHCLTLTLENPEAFPNYSVVCEAGTIEIAKRELPVVSGTVTQNREKPWRTEAKLPAGLESFFTIAGTLALNTSDAGRYTARREEELAPNRFVWETPLRITLKEGGEVTENFSPRYELDVTLNHSRFNITVPTEGLTFVYDGTAHEFTVHAETDEAGVEATVSYTVNGEPAPSPSLKDAGRYEVTATVGAENYDTETRSFEVVIERAAYTLGGSLNEFGGTYNGLPHGEKPHVSGVSGEDVSGCLSLKIGYEPFFGEGKGEVGWELVNAGVYQISYHVSGNPNYEDIEERTFTATIGRAEYEIEAQAEQRYTYAPNTPRGVGIGVSALPGNDYTVTYSHAGKASASAPVFSSAVPAGEEVSYTVSEGVNYEKAEGSYKVFVEKAEGTIDVAGIVRHYVYTGEVQRVERGATANNREDGVLTYENNTFTTVEEGNALRVTVRLAEGQNYTGAETAVTGFTVDKRTFTRLPDGVDAPAVGTQINGLHKTLAAVILPEHFRWAEEGPLTLGLHAYAAVYNPDEANNNDFSLTLSFTTRKEKLSLQAVGGEADLGGAADVLADFVLTGEDGQVRTEERSYVTFRAEGTAGEQGGLYPVSWSAELAANDYFELQGVRAGKVAFKRKAAEYDGTLYTVEDALARAESGKIILRGDAEFADGTLRSSLDEDPYPEETYRTVRENVTLLVPWGGQDSGSTAQESRQSFSPVADEGYVTLTLPADCRLNVKGTLIVNALRSSEGSRTSIVVGGNYGSLHLKEGATLAVVSGGTFESMGFTYGGGEVIAESGSHVFEPFAMVGWKGGSISCAVRNDVFPLNQYALPSLAAKTVFEAGAEYSVRACLTAKLSVFGGDTSLDLAVSFLGGGENSFLQLTEGTLQKETDEKSGTTRFTCAGKLTFRNLELSLNSTVKFNTKGLQVPVPGNFEILLKTGTEASVPDGVALKLLPGAHVRAEQGASLTVEQGGALIGYGETNASFDGGLSAWQDGGNKLTYPHASLASAYRGTPVFGYTAASPAVFELFGSLTVEDGGTFAAVATGGEGAQLTLASGAVTEQTIAEDKTPEITDSMAKLQALGGRGGSFFHATLSALGADGTAFEAGKTYRFSSEQWRE